MLGAIPLADTILTALPAPEFSFRLSRNGRFRDLRADSASNLATWLKHLNDEIAARSTISSGNLIGEKPASAGVQRPTLSRRDGLEASGMLNSSAAELPVRQQDEKLRQLDEKNKQLEAEVLMLKQRVRELEATNARLEAAGKGGSPGGGGVGGGEDEPEDAKAAELLKVCGRKYVFSWV